MIKDLSFKNVCFDYQGKSVFHGINIDFPPDQIFYITARVGAGKTTLANLLYGLLAPTSGEYLINGICVSQYADVDWEALRLKMAYGFENGGLVSNQTLYENMRLYLDYHNLYPPEQRKEFVFSLMQEFGIFDYKHLRPAHVTSGIRKAAGLARCFLNQPQMLILNQPLIHLSPEQIEMFIQKLKFKRKHKELKYIFVMSEDLALETMLPGVKLKISQTKFEMSEIENKSSVA
jgi:phospholipid/cholesterol/gamma-HCH transport system ATP-binding protein